MAFYVETSAFLKLAVAEESSPAMRQWFAGHRPCWSSQLLVTEAHRAATRLGVDPEVIDELLDGVALVLPSASTFQAAGWQAPPELRSLDALHLATAGELGPDLEGVVTYDQRVITGAQAAGFQVIRPE
ncbi:MAG: type II toxin-antitoxin system VapC family toxin [Candidatus Dormiibacterota bacterium]